MTDLERFWSKVDKSEDCWLWTAGKFTSGYAAFKVGGKNHIGSRWIWTQLNGSIPASPKMYVCHTCDNPPCVNPNHLFLGSHRDNMRDMLKKGRHRPGKDGVKLTENHVREIREQAKTVSQRMLAKKFGVSDGTISNIVREKSWTEELKTK